MIVCRSSYPREWATDQLAVATAGEGVGDLRAGEDRIAARGGREDDVGLGQVPVDFRQRQRDAAMPARQVLRMRERAVGDEQALDLAFDEVARGEFDRFAQIGRAHV